MLRTGLKEPINTVLKKVGIPAGYRGNCVQKIDFDNLLCHCRKATRAGRKQPPNACWSQEKNYHYKLVGDIKIQLICHGFETWNSFRASVQPNMIHEFNS